MFCRLSGRRRRWYFFCVWWCYIEEIHPLILSSTNQISQLSDKTFFTCELFTLLKTHNHHSHIVSPANWYVGWKTLNVGAWIESCFRSSTRFDFRPKDWPKNKWTKMKLKKPWLFKYSAYRLARADSSNWVLSNAVYNHFCGQIWPCLPMNEGESLKNHMPKKHQWPETIYSIVSKNISYITFNVLKQKST